MTVIIFVRNLNKLNIYYQSYPKSTKFDSFEQKNMSRSMRPLYIMFSVGYMLPYPSLIQWANAIEQDVISLIFTK